MDGARLTAPAGISSLQSSGERRRLNKTCGVHHPHIGDRVERRRAGVSYYGTVHYADQIQALVKWDDGSSSSLRLDRDKVQVIERAPQVAAPAAASSEAALAFSA